MYSDDCDCDQCQYERKTFVRIYRKDFDIILRKVAIETEDQFTMDRDAASIVIEEFIERLLVLMGLEENSDIQPIS